MMPRISLYVFIGVLAAMLAMPSISAAQGQGNGRGGGNGNGNGNGQQSQGNQQNQGQQNNRGGQQGQQQQNQGDRGKSKPGQEGSKARASNETWANPVANSQVASNRIWNSHRARAMSSRARVRARPTAEMADRTTMRGRLATEMAGMATTRMKSRFNSQITTGSASAIRLVHAATPSSSFR